MSQRTIGLLMATITAVSWAVLAIAVKFALATFSAGTIVWVRLTIAFVILFSLLLWKRREFLSILRRPPWLGLLAGVLIACNFYGFTKGIALTTATNAQVLIQLAPLTFAITSMILFKEYPTLLQGLGMLASLIGFGFFYWDQLIISLNTLEALKHGNLWILFAAITWASFALIQKQLLKTYQPAQFNVLIFLVSAIALFPMSNLNELTTANPWMLVLVVFLAFNTLIAYGALSEALTRIPAPLVSVIVALNPLLTLFIMTCLTKMEVSWIAGEPIGWRGFVGAMLVVIGLISTVSAPARLRSA